MSSGGRILKYALLAFVAAGAGFAVYKALPCCSGDKDQAAPVETAAAVPGPAEKAEAKTAAAPVKVKAGKTAEAKNAVVYYFYTNTRCSSCKTIEAYTREAVAARLAAGYKDWKIEFRGVNVDEEPNKHFVQDYWLNSKSVVVQKYAGGKALNWSRLDKVWQLLGDKDAFMNYVADETHKLLDSK